MNGPKKREAYKGNDDFKIQRIFSDDTIKKILLELKIVRLEIGDDDGIFDEKVQEPNFMIYLLIDQKVKSIDQLNNISLLLKTLVDNLTKLSSMNVKKASS